jgi:prepilin peptidase CpaA
VAAEEWVAIGIVLVACVTDLRSKRIPNVLTLPGALAGVLYHALWGGMSAGSALAGLAVGLFLFLPLYLLRGMGAGDVKLLAALGAWLGVVDVAWVAACAAIAGGLLAVLVSLWTGYGRLLWSNLWLLLTHWRVSGVRSLDSLSLDKGSGPRLAYAVPIAAGLVCAIWHRG